MKENIKALDGVRGLAAIYVLIHHARLYLTQPYSSGLSIHPEYYHWYDKLMVYFFSIFKFGHEAVILFFVLSGFLIHLKQADPTYQLKDFNPFIYFKKRFIRIYPTLLVSFVLCVVADYLIVIFTNANAIELFSKYQVSNFFYNLFLIPEAPIWGTNFPVWSLKHEWFFYLLYPILLWLYFQKKSLPILICFLSFVVYMFNFRIQYIGHVAYTLLIFLLGSSLSVLVLYNKLKVTKHLPYLLLLAFIYPFIDRNKQNPILDLVAGLIVIGFLTIIVSNKQSLINVLLAKVAWLGTFSYSLYLLHVPLLNFFQAITIYYNPANKLPYHYWYVIGSSLLVFPIIYIIYYFTERFAINYKQRI